MRKRKLLFYGNCQLGVLARWYSMDPRYELVVPEQRGLGFRRFMDYPACSMFVKYNKRRVHAGKHPDGVHKWESQWQMMRYLWRNADVVLFQHHSMSWGNYSTMQLKRWCGQHDSGSSQMMVPMPQYRYDQTMVSHVYLWYAHNRPDLAFMGPAAICKHMKQHEPDSELLSHLYKLKDYAQRSWIEGHETTIEQVYGDRNRKWLNCLKPWENQPDAVSNFPRVYLAEDQHRLLSFASHHPSWYYYRMLLYRLELMGLPLSPDVVDKIHEDRQMDPWVPGFICEDPRRFRYFHHLYPGCESWGDQAFKSFTQPANGYPIGNRFADHVLESIRTGGGDKTPAERMYENINKVLMRDFEA